MKVVAVGTGAGPADVVATLLRELAADVVDVHPDAGTDALRRATADADVVVVDQPVPPDALAATAALVCRITPFGPDAPDRPGTEVTVQAASGLAHVTGFPADPPTPVNAPIVAHLAGTMATVAVLAALRMAPAARPRQLEVSARDVVVMNLGTRLAHYFDTGADDGRHGNAYWMAAPFSLYRASDGFAMVCVFSDRQWLDLLRVIGRDDLAGDPRFADNGSRARHRTEIDALVEAWTSRRTVTAIVAAMNAAAVPAGPVSSPAQVLEDEALLARGVVQGGRIVNPLVPSGAAGVRLVPSGADGAPGPAALAGLRVLEVGVLTAGPFAGRLLADLGAEVVKLEVPVVGDPARRVGPARDGAGSNYFHTVAAGKRSVALDLRDPADLAEALALAEAADVVIENLGPGVVAGWGFGADAIRERNPGVVHCTVSGFGRRGPGAGLRAYDGLIQGRSGIMDLVRRPGRPPTKVGCSLADQVGPLFATVAILAALADRDRTGAGRDLDVSMLDVLAWMVAPALLDVAAGRAAPIGTLHPCTDGWVVSDTGRPGYWSTAGPPPATRPATPSTAAMTCDAAVDALAAAGAVAARCVDLAAVADAAARQTPPLVVRTRGGDDVISQIGSATGLPPPVAALRGLAPELGELTASLHGSRPTREPTSTTSRRGT